MLVSDSWELQNIKTKSVYGAVDTDCQSYASTTVQRITLAMEMRNGDS